MPVTNKAPFIGFGLDSSIRRPASSGDYVQSIRVNCDDNHGPRKA